LSTEFELIEEFLKPFPRGRAVAIRGAILAALAEDASLGEIEAAIEAASAAGIPGAQQVLF